MTLRLALAVHLFQATAVKLTVLQSVNSTAYIRRVAAFGTTGCHIPPEPPTPPCELQQNYRYQGVPLAPSHTAASVSACCASCRSTPLSACVAFTFDADGGMCQRLKAIGGGQFSKGVTSGSPLR